MQPTSRLLMNFWPIQLRNDYDLGRRGNTGKMKNWKTLKKETALDCGKFLKVEYHCVEFDDGTTIPKWPWVITPDMINVVVQREEGDFIVYHRQSMRSKGTLWLWLADTSNRKMKHRWRPTNANCSRKRATRRRNGSLWGSSESTPTAAVAAPTSSSPQAPEKSRSQTPTTLKVTKSARFHDSNWWTHSPQVSSKSLPGHPPLPSRSPILTRTPDSYLGRHSRFRGNPVTCCGMKTLDACRSPF